MWINVETLNNEMYWIIYLRHINEKEIEIKKWKLTRYNFLIKERNFVNR